MLKKIMFLGLIGMLLCSLATQLFALEPTAQQLKMLGNLSTDQKAALASKYGVNLGGQPASKVDISTPKVVIPATPKASRLERKVQQAGRDGSEQKDVPPNGPAKDLGIVKINNQKAADKMELQRAFAGFIAESKPLQVSTDLDQFGYSLFDGVPTTFAPATDIPVPAEYILGPGDELKIHLFGKLDQNLTLVVDREGVINFPNIGPLNVAGMNFGEARAYISGQIKDKTIGVTAGITMGALRSIRIFALGEVNRPGSYLVSGLSTLSHALFASGGVKKIGSLRDIQLKRNGKLVQSIDLYDFLLKGDTSADVRLLPGDVVFVPPIGPTVSVAGQVVRPAIYELRGERNVKAVLKIAGGLRPTAYRDQALIERVTANGERVVLKLALQGQGLQQTLQADDVLKIFSVLDIEENPIYLMGNVKRPGKYAWQAGMTLSQLLPNSDVLLPETFMDYGLIEREAPDNREPELVRFSLNELLSKKSPKSIMLNARDKVYIFNRAHFRQMPMVEVEGMVQSPGKYVLKRSMHLLDLILAGGGLLRDADQTEAELYRTDPQSKEVKILPIQLAAVLKADPLHNIELQDLDRLVVHSLWETKTQDIVNAQGELHHPGTFALAQGMRVADLIFAAGSVTERAYLKSAEITRYEIIDGEQRVSQHMQINLQSALRGDETSNILLRPFDVLNVRTLSNWRPAEQVKVSGEIKYPGIYPIEEGEHLSALLERAGGFLPRAYLPAAVFIRESIRANQQQQMDEMAARIKTEIAQMQVGSNVLNDPQLRARSKKNLDSAQRVLEQLQKVKATGRLVIQLTDIKQLKGSDFDLALVDGDRLHVPQKPDEVHVIGQVYNQTALIYRSDLERQDYLAKAGGPTRFADKKHIYVVRVSGEVDPQRGWGRKKILPGDVIVVPEKLDRFNLVDSTLDWSRVLMQLGVGVASMKTIGVL